MKKTWKAALILIFLLSVALCALSFFGVRNGSFQPDKKQETVGYYYFSGVKAGSVDIRRKNIIYSVRSGAVRLINGKDSGFIKCADKKEYYIVSGRMFSGVYKKSLYEKGLKSDFSGLKRVDGKELCFEMGVLFNGILDGRLYSDGEFEKGKSGFVSYKGKSYLVKNGSVFSGIFGGEYYTNGVSDTSKNGFITVDGAEYLFKNGKLFTGFEKKKYYSDGVFQKEKSGELKVDKTTYYIENGVLYSGFKNSKMYKEGVPDKEYSGFKIIDDKEYYFTEGVITEVPDDVPVKILLVGNSYTYYNGMGQMLCKFIKATGKSALVVRVTRGGWSLRSLMSKTPAYCAWLDGKQIAAGDKKLSEVAKTDFAELERAGRWDYILAQNNDSVGKLREGNLQFFEDYKDMVPEPSHILFNAVYYGPSPAKNRYEVIASAGEECGATVINTSAYYASYNSYFGRKWVNDLTIGDNPKHPASKGAYLMALIIYTKLYGNEALAKSSDSSHYIPVYNSDGGTSEEFAPNKYKKKKMTKDYAMTVTKANAKALQTFVYNYSGDYLGAPLTQEDSDEKTD